MRSELFLHYEGLAASDMLLSRPSLIEVFGSTHYSEQVHVIPLGLQQSPEYFDSNTGIVSTPIDGCQNLHDLMQYLVTVHPSSPFDGGENNTHLDAPTTIFSIQTS